MQIIDCFVTEYSVILPKRPDNHITIENANNCIFFFHYQYNRSLSTAAQPPDAVTPIKFYSNSVEQE